MKHKELPENFRWKITDNGYGSLKIRLQQRKGLFWYTADYEYLDKDEAEIESEVLKTEERLVRMRDRQQVAQDRVTDIISSAKQRDFE